MIRTLSTGTALVVLGVVLTGLGVHQLGVVRASRKWPLARRPRVGRGVAGFEVAVGILTLAGGGVLLTTLLTATLVIRVAFGAGVGLAVLIAGMVTAAKLTDRVELNALIRSPSPLYRTTVPGPGGPSQTATSRPSVATSGPAPRDVREPDGPAPDPAVPPDAVPGWVLTDTDGSWYLCVTTAGGPRLVLLPDFQLVEPAYRELAVAGTVELSVWPLADAAVVP